MSSKIQKLPKILADQIAAGEVIDGPASVIKELVENAIDAGATEIHIRLKEGGKEEIHVQDNGQGVSKDDLPLAIERHATSKIQSFDDLMRLDSHGFRGEALSSIAAISKISITSSVLNEDTWTLDADPVKGFKLTQSRNQAGTTVSVYHLFSWVPARKKYLGSATVEAGRCLKILWPLMLHHPQVAFVVDAKGKPTHFGPCENSQARFFQIFPMHRSNETFKVAFSYEDVSCEGFLCNPLATLSDRRHLFTAVNHRIVTLPPILGILRRTYAGIDGKRGCPWGALHFSVPQELVDFNVDPKKDTVRLHNQASIIKGLQLQLNKIIHEGLMISPTIHRVPLASALVQPKYDQTSSTPRDFFTSGPSRGLQSRGLQTGEIALNPASISASFKTSATKVFADETLQIEEPNIPKPAEHHEDSVNWEHLKFVGIVDALFIVATDDKDIIFVDQHALHERILYEKCLKSLNTHATQPALVPEQISIDNEESARLSEAKSMLSALGFHISVSNEQVTLDAYPQYFNFQPNLKTLLSWVMASDLDLPTAFEKHVFSLIGDLCCKRSVKRGDHLSPTEVQSLFKEASQVIGPKIACQHGRPFVVKIPRDMIYKGVYRHV